MIGRTTLVHLLIALVVLLGAPTVMATNPVDYGAISGDGLDDGPAFRSALADACAVNGSRLIDVPAGVFDLNQPDPLTIGALTVTGCDGLTIRGKGLGTVLRQVPRVMNNGENYYMIRVVDSDLVTIRDMQMDGRQSEFSCSGGLCEQIHLVVIYDSVRTQVFGVTFSNSYGDGIKLSGRVRFVNVHDCVFEPVRRMGVTVAGGSSYDVLVTRNQVNYTEIHVESNAPNDRMLFVGNRIRGTDAFGTGYGGITVGIQNTGNDVIIAENTLTGAAALYAIYINNLVIGHNYMNTTNEPSMYLRRIYSGLVLFGNNTVTPFGTTAAYLLEGTTFSNMVDTVFANNYCEHQTLFCVRTNGTFERLAASGNVIRSTRINNSVGISGSTVGSVVDPVGVMSFYGNVFLNEEVALAFEVRTTTVDDIAVVGNSIYSTVANSIGVYNVVYNNVPYSADYIPHCRADANVIDVVGYSVRNTDIGGVPDALPGEGCILHGDAVPP